MERRRTHGGIIKTIAGVEDDAGTRKRKVHALLDEHSAKKHTVWRRPGKSQDLMKQTTETLATPLVKTDRAAKQLEEARDAMAKASLDVQNSRPELAVVEKKRKPAAPRRSNPQKRETR